MKNKTRLMFVLMFVFGWLSFAPTKSVQAADCVWNGTIGDWTDTSKWTCGVVPDADDYVTINGGTVTLDSNVTVNSLTLTNGTLTGTGHLTAGTVNWSGGTMSGAGSTTASEAVNFSGSANITLYERAFYNEGTAAWNKTGYLYLQTATSVFYNLPGATFTIQSSGSIMASGYGMISNAGTFTKTSVGTSVQLQVDFDNFPDSVVRVESGTLELYKNVCNSNSYGSFHVESGAKLRLAYDIYNMSGTDIFTGSGTIEIAGTVVIDGSFTFLGDIKVIPPGTLNLFTDTTTVNTDILTLSNILTGPGHLTARVINWSGGTMSGAGSTTASEAANFSGSSTYALRDRAFYNEGTATWNSTYLLSIQGATTVFYNQAGATFTVQSSGDYIVYSDHGGFYNAGTLNLKTGKIHVDTFTQAASGITNMPIHGTTPVTNYSQVIADHFNLAGNLSVSFTGGFTPVVGNSFTLFLSTSEWNGDFASKTVSPISGIAWNWKVESYDLILLAVEETTTFPVYLPLILR
jgi:hypothetical protein